jgi:hypothetical protein
VLQPAEICHVNRPEYPPGAGTCSVRSEDDQPRTAAILYSLANFSTHQFTLPTQTGIVASVTLSPDVSGLGWAATLMVHDPMPQVAPLADHLDDPDVAAEAARIDAHLGTGWKR